MAKKPTKQFQHVLFEPVTGFTRLKQDDFAEKFSDEVAELDEVTAVWRLDDELGSVLELSNGYAIHIDRTSRWSLYETEAHFNERTLYSAWAAFVRGCWTDRVPTEAGSYFCRDKDLGRRTVRELRRVEGRLRDVSGGFVRPGRVTEWQGDWWDRPIPNLPNAY